MRPEPLRPHDPVRLGSYELVGRLGEGGMGTVYLAKTAAGTQVAVKVVRADLSPDDEFRRRFRSEVARARQVPPFCTAEVLDADPDADHPYLVVEYVDGPTLAQVVDDRGPLTAANLHSVAIGVATALTAIHGAGVIHRDLKPRNVLLAPGTPKVIDFGIARAVGSTATGNTAPEFMMGTVAYMAPERFGDAEVPLTAAADIFAWGGVVMYAGTGRTPFGGDSPPATAGRILTQEPDLSGLPDPLRELVAYALRKNPAERPSARELLDLLVAGPSRPAATAAALAGQPDLRAAASQAQSVTGVLTAPAPGTPAGLGQPVATGEPPVPEGPTVPVSAVPGLVEPDRPDGRRRRWFLPAAILVLILAVVAGTMMIVFGSPADPTAGPAGTTPATTSAPAPAPPAGPVLITDDLDKNRLWLAKTEPDGRSSCVFTGGELHVRIVARPLYKCRGPQDTLPEDLTIDVGVRLLTDGACAAVWYHFKLPHGGRLVRICQDNIFVGTHQSAEVTVTRTLPLDNPIAVGGPPTRIGLHVTGETVTVTRDGVSLGDAPLGNVEIMGNRVLLGVFLDRDTPDTGSAEVAFDHIEVRGPSAPGPR
ncbi:serine/threonine-protein kinase [Actinoplanes sp. Pm04-4]|uniref:Serine/threonine-protein kinase n=1 Tax=Paractinoplanes pyxinae TaxID=2997416 RepID=A0ABT4AW53_9ACTN|nr:serine/threonine-protein kinase [Actinoplanes pyxinae]MCY1138442.1 serine/threonine-protein kinase [Actinoplanes pyxinae]